MSESSPKILVTGAAGNLGRFVLAELARERFDVRASDCVEDSDAVFPIHVTHLLDLPSVRKLMQGIDIVIHLANHAYQRDNEITFNENVAMNMNVFQAAADLGARKILFASSVQVIGSEGGDAPIDRHPRFPSLPLNEETPPFPTNSYALSKLAGEVQLRYFATCHELEGIAIRFPGMHPNERHFSKPDWVPPPVSIRQGFSNLTYEDAARLLAAIIRTGLPGFRVYFPSSRENRANLPTSRLLKEFYPGIPCRRTLSDEDPLVDISTIIRETGWTPQDRHRT